MTTDGLASPLPGAPNEAESVRQADLTLGESAREVFARMRQEPARDGINLLSDMCHDANINWWRDLSTGELKQRNVGELLMLCVSELAEAMEGHRKNLKDDKLPHRSMMEVELADCLIRIFDLAGGLNLDLGGAFVEKMAYNRTRADHKTEHRQGDGGKKY
jgi:NTP pyrophosphatase (non-canonical NTP hydrolase)